MPELCKGSCSSSVRRIEHIRDTHYPAVAVGSAGSQNYGERVDEKILPGTDHTSRSMVKGVLESLYESGEMSVSGFLCPGLHFPDEI